MERVYADLYYFNKKIVLTFSDLWLFVVDAGSFKAELVFSQQVDVPHETVVQTTKLFEVSLKEATQRLIQGNLYKYKVFFSASFQA